jgi:hypothetical protein
MSRSLPKISCGPTSEPAQALFPKFLENGVFGNLPGLADSRISVSAISALPLSQNCLTSQSWRFVAHEVRVISTKKEALQALSIPKNCAGNPLAFQAKEIDESVDRGGKTLVNQRI